MCYDIKSKECIEIAEYAYNMKSYNSSINRYYYGVYQLILFKLDNKNLKVTNDDSTDNSHNVTIATYRDALHISSTQKFAFNNNISTLKRLRCKADYKKVMVNQTEVNKAKKTCYELISFINKS